jgi:DNA-binding transcriptional LysR family regulator
MNLSMQGLWVFVSVLEHGSLTAAGRDLGMTQPAVSITTCACWRRGSG